MPGKIKVTTQNSSYMLDLDNHTWSTDSTSTRTPSGTFNEIEYPPQVGRGIILWCDPINPQAFARMIITSPVVSVEEL